MEERVERVLLRYAKKWEKKDPSYVRSMMSYQWTPDGMREVLDQSIEKESHGDRIDIDNSWSGPDMRKAFFRLLNQIDTYGELRTEWILRKLKFNWDIREMIQFLQKSYNHPSRYYHSWEHIVDSLTTLFEMAIDTDMADEDIMIVGWAILWHDLVYEVDKDKYPQNESNSARLWSKILASWWVKDDLLELIEDLIKETRHGRANIRENLHSHVMHDVDMSILWSDQGRYMQYARDIRPEFRPMASGDAFESLRKERFLIPMRDGFRYKTEWAQERFGRRVIENIERELQGI